VRKKNGDYFNGTLKQVIMYGNNEFLDCCSVCYKFNSIINHENDLYYRVSHGIVNKVI
jgi:hypothetical protein